MADIFEEIVKVKREGGEAALATIVITRGSTPREQGSKMLIKKDGTIIGSVGGGCTEAEVWQEAQKVMEEGKPKVLHFDMTGRSAEEEGMICGGTMDVYLEPIVSQPTLYLFGGGHISLSIAKIGKLVGFDVVVIDDRQGYANKERFPEADRLIVKDFPLAFPELVVNKASYIVIVTRGHAHDEEVLEWAITAPARYIGMIGSKKKVKTVYSHIIERGGSEEALNKVHAPIGLSIQAQTPEEIAVSIMAEIIRVRRGGEAGEEARSMARPPVPQATVPVSRDPQP
ncbi:MAG: XdhC family protein [Chloroflexi bacterium]|nr:XdhC family protein [Chloroflexota bacterium]